MSSPPRSRRGGGGGSSNSKTDASHLLNFRTAGPPPGAISSSAASSPQRQHHDRRNNKGRGDGRDRDNHHASLRAERRARRALSSAFYLHASSSHAFVLSHEARRRRCRQGRGPGQHHHFGPDTGMKWDDVRMVEWLVETTATTGGSGDGDGARAATAPSTPSSSPLSCPICLDDATSARMARCGHSFCYPCILRHLYTGGGTGSSDRDSSPARKCPCCSEAVRLEDLRPVIFRSVAPPRMNRVMRFRRLCRPRGMCVARVSTGDECDGDGLLGKESSEGGVSFEKRDNDDDDDAFPLLSDPSAPFCRYSHLDPGQEAYIRHLQSDLAALRDTERVAQSMGGVDATEAAFVRMALEAVGLELRAATDEAEKANIEPQGSGSGCLNETGGREDDDTNRRRQRPSVDSKTLDGSTVADGEGGAVTQFYQAEDGQLCFLSSFNMLCLNAEYGGGTAGDDVSRCGTKGAASGDHVTQMGADPPNPSGARSRGGKQRKQHKKKQQHGQHHSQPSSSPLPSCATDPPSSPGATPHPAEEGDFDQVLSSPETSTSSALDGGNSPRRQGEAREGNGERQRQEGQLPDDQTQDDPPVPSSSEDARRRHLPDVVEGQVVDVETVHLTADARRRYTFLSHLPLYVDVKLVEVHFGPKVLGEATRRRFKAEMDRRKKKRRGRAQAEKKRDQAAAKSARERELKERQKWQGQAVDWNDEFFRSGTGSPPSSPLSDDFGPKLVGISGAGDGNSSRQPKSTVVRPNHPIATPPRADDGVFSFRAVCATNGVWPGLMDAATAPAAAGSPVRSMAPTESTGTGKRPVGSGAWGSRGAHASTTKSGSGGWKCAASAVEGTTLPPPAPPEDTLSSTGEKNRGKGAKGKGKHKVLLFSTGGHRGRYGYG